MLTSGFFDSVSGDRLYDAAQMGKIMDGIFSDGVFEDVGNKFAVVQDTGMLVNVQSGRAWFDNLWTYNDSNYSVTVSDAHATLNRIDTIVLETNKEIATRSNSIKIVTGTPDASPTAPTLTNTANIKQYPLADIAVNAAVTEILTVNITNRVGTVDCPYIQLYGVPEAPIPAMELIFEENFATVIGDITISNIPQTYKHLKLVVEGVLDSTFQTRAWIDMNLNGGGQGRWHALDSSGLTAGVDEGFPYHFGDFPTDFGTLPYDAEARGWAEVNIFNYATVSVSKAISGFFGNIARKTSDGDPVERGTIHVNTGIWYPSTPAAVSSIQLDHLGTYGLKAGSSIRLYGIL